MLIITIYRAPNTNVVQFSEILHKTGAALSNLPQQATEVIIMGDFNFAHPNWSNITANRGTIDEKFKLQSP